MAISAELKAKVAAYQPGEAAKTLAAETRLLLIAGPAGSGKSAILKELLKAGPYTHIVSHTTRQPRTGEVNGRDYYFIDEASMAQMIEERQLVEVEAIYDEYLSGTSLSEIRRVKDSGQVGVTAIEVGGVKSYVDLNPNTQAVFVLPPSYDAWVKRLAERGEDQDSIKRMLSEAQGWLEQALKAGYFRFVINADLHQVVADIRAFAEESEPKAGGGDDTRVEHAWHVLGELKRQLSS